MSSSIFLNLRGGDQVKKYLQECVEGQHGGLAAEIKCAVVSFQVAPPGMCPYYTLAGLPQTINENNDWGNTVMEACEAAATEVGNFQLLNTTTDGVSCRSPILSAWVRVGRSD